MGGYILSMAYISECFESFPQLALARYTDVIWCVNGRLDDKRKTERLQITEMLDHLLAGNLNSKRTAAVRWCAYNCISDLHRNYSIPCQSLQSVHSPRLSPHQGQGCGLLRCRHPHWLVQYISLYAVSSLPHSRQWVCRVIVHILLPPYPTSQAVHSPTECSCASCKLLRL